MNVKELNGGSTYVFKTSKERLQLAISMSNEGQNFLSEEFAFMDATVKRIPGMKALGLSVYHPLLQRILWIARMEFEYEDAETVALFLQLLDEALQDYTGKLNASFEPIGWILDEGGGLQAGNVRKCGPQVKSKIATCRYVFALYLYF